MPTAVLHDIWSHRTERVQRKALQPPAGQRGKVGGLQSSPKPTSQLRVLCLETASLGLFPHLQNAGNNTGWS